MVNGRSFFSRFLRSRDIARAVFMTHAIGYSATRSG